MLVKCLWGFFTSSPEILSVIAFHYSHLMDEIDGVQGFWGQEGNSPIKWRELEKLVYGIESEEPIQEQVPAIYSIYRMDNELEFLQCMGTVDGDTTTLGSITSSKDLELPQLKRILLSFL